MVYYMIPYVFTTEPAIWLALLVKWYTGMCMIYDNTRLVGGCRISSTMCWRCRGLPQSQWYDMICCYLMWDDMTWCGMVWLDIWYGMVWYGMIWYSLPQSPRHDMWYHVTWFCVVWYGMQCHIMRCMTWYVINGIMWYMLWYRVYDTIFHIWYNDYTAYRD